jgi:hypothetical protein
VAKDRETNCLVCLLHLCLKVLVNDERDYRLIFAMH